MGSLVAKLADRIDRFGPLPFDEVMDLALYDPEGGFFATSGSAGRRGDFLTSPEVGPLFGAVLARAIDSWWESLGEPDPFLVVDAGAGSGTLARGVLAAEPSCSGAMTLVLVESSDVLRSQHQLGLPLVPPAVVLPAASVRYDGEPKTESGAGPRVVSLPGLPALNFKGVVVANELLDNLPFRIVEWEDDGWHEIRVGREGDAFTEVLAPCPELTRILGPLAGRIPTGARVPVQTAAASWVRTVLGRLTLGRLVVFDYAATTSELVSREGGWLRTFRAHERGLSPLQDLGEQDITSDVAIDQVTRDHPPTLV